MRFGRPPRQALSATRRPPRPPGEGLARLASDSSAAKPAAEKDDPTLRQTFDSVMGESLFGQLLQSMRKTVGRPAYFHGGRGEEVFQQQLDQIVAQKIAQTSGSSFTGPMYELFNLNRSR